ncbi:MAG: HAD family phosphatase [Muribaculaceae bacterium]|jgi:putative hydrolase of the HAD superfamily
MLKNLLFDLGGVIVDIRRQNCVNAFLQLGFSDIEAYLGEYGQKGPFLLLEEGRISPDEFRREVRRHIPSPVSDSQIDRAFNAFITGISRERLQALRNLRAKGHRLYVISNTNPIMWHGPIDEAFRQEGLTISDYFDGIVTSFNIGVCKPDPAIFRAVTDKFGIIPSETIFLDDSAENCRIGAELGFSPLHVPAESSFMPILEKADL